MLKHGKGLSQNTTDSIDDADPTKQWGKQHEYLKQFSRPLARGYVQHRSAHEPHLKRVSVHQFTGRDIDRTVDQKS